jgi:hypothetical protein
MDLLIEWLYSKNLVALKGEECTHVLLTGGRFFIPHALTNSFLDRYATTICNGENRMSFIERSGRLNFRMFADIDIYEDLNIEDLMETILSKLPRPLMEHRISILRREFHDGKQGVHLVWPDVYVSDDGARALGEGWMSNLSEEYKHLVDLSVYKNNGLRMPWSIKPLKGIKTSYIPWRLLHISASHGITIHDEFPSRDHLDVEDVKKWLRLSVLYPKEFKSSNKAPEKRIIPSPTQSSTLFRSSSTTATTTLDTISNMLTIIVNPADAIIARKLVFNKDAALVHTTNKYCAIANRVHTSNHVYYRIEWDDDVHDSLRVLQCCFSLECRKCVSKDGLLVSSVSKESDMYADLAGLMANVPTTRKKPLDIRAPPATTQLRLEALLQRMKL